MFVSITVRLVADEIKSSGPFGKCLVEHLGRVVLEFIERCADRVNMFCNRGGKNNSDGSSSTNAGGELTIVMSILLETKFGCAVCKG